MGVLLVLVPVLVHGQEVFYQPIFTAKAWQIGWVVLLLGFAFRVCWKARCRSQIKIELVAAAPKVLALFYGLWLLLRYFFGPAGNFGLLVGLVAVWFVTFVVTAIVLRWQFLAQLVFGHPLEEPEQPTVPAALAALGVELTRSHDDD
jgi:hypothetical protein